MICDVSLRELFACLFMLAGAIFFIGSAVGMMRLPDFYCRVHASGNSETLGCVLSFIGLIILEGPTLTAAKIGFVFLFVFLANPIGSHILCKAAYKTGHSVWTVLGVRESEAARALNQEHILSEPLGNLNVDPREGEGTVKIYSGGHVSDTIGTIVDVADAPVIGDHIGAHVVAHKSFKGKHKNHKKHIHTKRNHKSKEGK